MPNDAGGVYQGTQATCKTIQPHCVSTNKLFCLGYVQCTGDCDGYSAGEACLYTGNSGNFKICQGFCTGDQCHTNNTPKVRGGEMAQV